MPVLLRTSERSTFKSCRQKWHTFYVRERRPRLDAPALRFGTLVHKALELRYPPGTKRGPHPAETFRELYEEERRGKDEFAGLDEDGEGLTVGDLGVAMLNGFIQEYGEDERYEVIASELRFRTPLGRGANGARYVGTLDNLLRDLENGAMIINDWKTCKSFWHDFAPMDEQSAAYWTYGPYALVKAGYIKRPEDLSHVMLTFLRKAMPDERPVNEEGFRLNANGSVSKKQPAPLFKRTIIRRGHNDRAEVHRRVLGELADMQAARRGELTIYKTPTIQGCRGCPFRGPCELQDAGADWEDYLLEITEPHDPYSTYDLEAEGKDD